MLFNSYIFIFAFFPITILGYYLLNDYCKIVWRNFFLLAMSLFFVGYMNIVYLMVLLGSMIFNYLGVRYIQNKKSKHIRKAILVILVASNVFLLLICKYYNFFVENINILFETQIILVQFILPLGISFYTFQQIAYIVDCYKNENIKDNVVQYSLFISFFPQFVQGPVMVRNEFMNQIQRPINKSEEYEYITRGLYGFSLGLGKKVLIADTLSKIVNAGYINYDELNIPSALIIILAYTLQIYFDFSGYCDMAMGLSEMFGIHIPINFNSPYKAKSIDEFWDRWHMTLTRFFTKYVYFPLGGSRKGFFRTLFNILIIFLISGLWHGAAWTFILWGALHGIAMIVKRILRQLKCKLPTFLEAILTFVFVNIAWVFFRAENISMAWKIISSLWKGGFGFLNKQMVESIDGMVEVSLLQRIDVLGVMDKLPGSIVIGFIIILTILCFTLKNTQEKMQELHSTWEKACITIGLLLYSVMSFSGISEFIYINF